MRSRSIEVGKAYKNGYGSIIRIISDQRCSRYDHNFVGLLSTDNSPHESIVGYNAEGVAEGLNGSDRSRLILPDPYVRLADVLREINVTDMRASSRDELDAAICRLPTKEFTDV